MNESSFSLAWPDEPSRVRAIAVRTLRAAFTVFVLDGLYVIVVFSLILHRTTAERIFQGIAYALVGPGALSGGHESAALGILLHFAVSLGWSAVWMAVYESSASVRRVVDPAPRAAVVGAAYGMVVWLAMHFIVLPFTYAKPGPIFTLGSLLVLLAHLLVVGPPIVLLERRGER